MGMMTELLFAYVVGIVIGGIAASILELTVGQRLSFAPPFFSREQVPVFILAILAAGPFMLVNDALMARRQAQIALTTLTGVFATASIWLWALGAVAIGVAVRLGAL